MAWSLRLPASRAALVALALSAPLSSAACGSVEPPLPARPARAGGAALAGSLEVTVVEDGSGRVVAGASVRALSVASGALLAEGVTGPDGIVRLSDAALTEPLTVDVSSSPTASQLFMGVRTDELVVSLPAPSPAMVSVSGSARGLPSTAGTTATIGVGAEVSLLRAFSLSAAMAVDCAPTGDGSCAFRASIPRGSEASAAATVRDASGAAVSFVVGQLQESGATLAAPVAALELTLSLPSGSGLTEIVGVPGLARDGQLVLLPQTPEAPGLVRVPDLAGEPSLAGASYWVIVEGRPMLGLGGTDRSARSVLFRRGVLPGSTPSWSAWMGIPDPVLDAEARVSFDAVPGADVHVVDWIDHEGAVIGSAWVLDATLLAVEQVRPSGVPVSAVHAVRVRALDTLAPPTPAGFAADAIELGVERFSERDVTL